MAVIEQILEGIQAGKETYNRMVLPEVQEGEAPSSDTSYLTLGDNAAYMRQLLAEGYAGSFRQIYIDPPFFTKSKFNATVSVTDAGGSRHRIRHLVFDDTFERSLECYIENLTYRLLLMKDLLADDGTMWVHLDWHSSHYVKVVLDDLLGEKNFVNEIVWCYKSGGSGKKHFSRKHDTILVYSKKKNYYISIPEEKSYNRGFKPYNFKGVKEYRDDQGWYTLVNMKDVWNVDMVGRTSAERTGYATQKPMGLMKRILRAGSEEGDLVGDFFCGSGSFLTAAEDLGRRWIGCDNEKLAVSMARKRMYRQDSDFSYVCMNDEQIAEGRANVKVYSSEQLENDNQLIRCGITEFRPDVDTGYIRVSDRPFIEETLESDPYQLIDYVLVENAKGSDTEHLVITEGFDDIRLVTGGINRIVIADVFGREYLAEIS